MTPARPDVVAVLPDKLGGVFSFVQDLLRARRPDGLTYRAVRTANLREPDTRAAEPLGADRESLVEHSLPAENLYSVLRRLEREVGHGPGVLFANDWIELALAHWTDTGRAVVAMVHGDFDFYYQLAVLHEPVIDQFVTYTDRVYRRLGELLPHRRRDIRMLRYGVPIPAMPRRRVSGPLRLLYLGRLHADKGVFELPLIDERLQARGVDVRWTVHGAGPARDELVRLWRAAGDRVRWSAHAPIDTVRALYPEHDVFVLPSRFEALPVALLEAGAAGVVPVVSDLPSGIPEIVENGVSGFRVRVGDIDGFVEAIGRIAADRDLLDAMSVGVRQVVSTRFDVTVNTAAYQSLFASWQTLRRPRPARLVMPYGSRLDRPWLPNAVVRAVRARWRSRG